MSNAHKKVQVKTGPLNFINDLDVKRENKLLQALHKYANGIQPKCYSVQLTKHLYMFILNLLTVSSVIDFSNEICCNSSVHIIF